MLQDQGTVKNDEGTVQYDKVQVGFCHITSPISGRVGLRLVDPGNVVQANGTTALAVITQEQPITVIFTVAEPNRSSTGSSSQLIFARKTRVETVKAAAARNTRQPAERATSRATWRRRSGPAAVAW